MWGEKMQRCQKATPLRLILAAGTVLTAMTLSACSASPREMLMRFADLQTLGSAVRTEQFWLRDSAQTHLEHNMHYETTLFGKSWRRDTQVLELSGADVTQEQLLTAFRRLPLLKQINLLNTSADAKMIADLSQSYPEYFFLWEVPIGNRTYRSDLRELDLTGVAFSSREEIEAFLPFFPALERVIVCDCGLSNETLDELNRDHETIRFVWNIYIQGHAIRTDSIYFYPYKLNRYMYINNEEASLLRYCTDMVAIDIGHNGMVTDCEWAAYMPNLKYLILAETGIVDISPLSHCKELVFLELFTTKICDYTPLLECTKLEDLNLGQTYGSTEPICKMTWLKNLWWFGAPTQGKPCSNAEQVLPGALPNTTIRLWLMNPNVENGWRQLDNYYAMRDIMGMFYLA